MDTSLTQAAYLNARIRAMKSLLMPRDALEDLLEQDDLGVLIEVLLNSEYKTELASALTRSGGAEAVEDAVSRNLMNTFRRILLAAAGPLRDLGSLFLARWDLAAAKSLLRNCHRGLGAQAGEPMLFPGPTLGGALVRDLAERGSMDSLARGLAAWNPGLCGCLIRESSDSAEQHDIAALENALDRAYLVQNVRQLADNRDENSRLLRQVLRIGIDGINLRILLHDKSHGLCADEIAAWLLPEGTLSSSVLTQMAAAPNVEEAMILLGSTRYRELVEGLYQFIQTGRFAPLERLFEFALLNELKRMARAHVFSIAVLMHYSMLKYNEVVNLRLIARGEARHLPRGRIREELMHA